MYDVVSLTQKLIAFDTVNPPGNEHLAAKFIGSLLEENGFNVEYVPFEENRVHLIAEKGCSAKTPPVVFSGHFDTVPLGAKPWTVDPFGGEVKDGKLYGRGSTDMKGGVAAMVIAAIESFEHEYPQGGVRLVLTAAEELGCRGARDLVANYKNLGCASGIIVGEPTGNVPGIGHKGGVYLNLSAFGTTAHSSMPHLGDNAIYKVCRAISKVEHFDFSVEKDPLLGFSTINVGMMSGGLNINSVPDSASFTIDARTTTKIDHKEFIHNLKKDLGDEITIEILVDLPAISTDEDAAFVKMVYEACGISKNVDGFPKSLPYLTDGSVLQKAYGGAPTIILGPGEIEMAHQTDEYCYIDKLQKAVEIYKNIILKRLYNE
ncbi:M20 family metallopeptidase [Aestuariibaculum suncheonense]|uniref:M20 family metallopeptidase n=1 Tax=Aestuariibaculum suncheonense TaxID=1028745 RepID=A0A8J6UBE6_9FLAO|nr:M20 family metallopeptidase [Aestuariibaculum suncheonense]MBD0835397.1 M20 family metallopeptidase [Aestuariibaculum suncheonense]